MREPDFLVQSTDVELAVYTWGIKPNVEHPREVLVLVHGFPDRATFWELVAQQLQDDFYVVAYDMRGCARSTHISGTRHYRFDLLLEDLYAVIDAVSPTQKVHLVGHDWGGIYGWNAVAELEGARRIASFTTMSPALEQVGFYLRRRLLNPTPRHLLQMTRQLLRNSLMTFFTLPLLPELLFMSGLGAVMFRALVQHYEHSIQFQKNEGMEGDAMRYLGIYRANLLQRVLAPKSLEARVPVHVLAARYDPFLPPSVFECSRECATDYSESSVEAAHWAPLSRPVEMTGAIRAFVSRHQQAS